MIAPKPIFFVNMALSVLLLWACWGAFARPRPARKPVKIPGGAQTPEPAGNPTADRARAHYTVIEEADIFRNKDVIVKPPEPTPVPPTPVPLPPLALELKVTAIFPKDNMLKAGIYNKEKKSFEYYGKNDVIPDTGGAKIVEITRNRVTIDRQGQLETLQTYPDEPKQLLGTAGTMRGATGAGRQEQGETPQAPSDESGPRTGNTGTARRRAKTDRRKTTDTPATSSGGTTELPAGTGTTSITQ